MKIKPTRKNDGIIMTLSTDEAVRLEAIIGRLTGNAARCFPFYDEIANVLEEHGQVENISRHSNDYLDHLLIIARDFGEEVLDYPEGF